MGASTGDNLSSAVEDVVGVFWRLLAAFVVGAAASLLEKLERRGGGDNGHLITIFSAS